MDVSPILSPTFFDTLGRGVAEHKPRGQDKERIDEQESGGTVLLIIFYKAGQKTDYHLLLDNQLTATLHVDTTTRSHDRTALQVINRLAVGIGCDVADAIGVAR